MRLSWNEVRVRAATFADEWSNAVRETSETQSFYNAFFRVFGVERRSVARYEEHVAKLDNSSGFIDLFWPGVLIVEQKSAGRDLGKAYGQAGEYFDALKERDRPRYILVSDFQTFELHDLDERTEDPIQPQGPSRARGALRLHPRRAEAHLPRSGSRQHQGRGTGWAAARRAPRRQLPGPRPRTLPGAHRVLPIRRRHRHFRAARHLPGSSSKPAPARTAPTWGHGCAQLFRGAGYAGRQTQSATLDEDLARFPYVNGDLFREPLADSVVRCIDARSAAGRMPVRLVEHFARHIRGVVSVRHGAATTPRPEARTTPPKRTS